MDYEGLLELVKKRRSIRRFKPEPIPDEYVDKIIEVARWAPSGANSQPWEFIVIKQPEVKDKIAELIKKHRNPAHQVGAARETESGSQRPDNPPQRLAIEDAPVYIILCGDTRTKATYPLDDSQRAKLTFDSSLASALLYLHLAAASLGLASQWVSAIAGPSLQCLTKELLGIPEELEIYDMAAVGYPAAAPRPRLVRARAEMVHYDHYDRSIFRTEEKIKEVATTHHHS